MSQNIVLRIVGKDGTAMAFTGWKEMRIYRSINNICGTFSFKTSERYPENPYNWFTRIGDPCLIEVEDQSIITGYIDDINIAYDSVGHTIELIGRDATCDLIDCNYIEKTKTWTEQSLKKIVTDLCNPYGIVVDIENSVTSICNEIFHGEKTIGDDKKIAEFISELCLERAILPVSYGDGILTLTRAGTRGKTDDIIQLGYNVYKGSANYSNKERFSNYIAKGQAANKFYTTMEIKTKASNTKDGQIEQGYKDINVKRYRPLVEVLKCNATDDICRKYAAWLGNIRAGNSRKFTYTLVEWTQILTNGINKIWDINTTVQVIDKQFGLKNTFLISAVEFIHNDSDGTITNLTLVDPAAYKLSPVNNIVNNKTENMISTMDQDETDSDVTIEEF